MLSINFLKINKFTIGLIAILALGSFLRLYNFSDWLHFEIDQARDVRIAVVAAEDGAGNLPLQGPRAAGSFLRLGPAFYYMQYVGAKVFGATPAGVAAAVPILSILTLPLFYFFCRRFFSPKYAISLTGLFSVSLFMVMYSRFAWNPNPIPFFMLLAAYALLRVVDEGEKRRGLWLAVSAFALGIGMQLHFLVFISLPVMFFLFFLIKRPRLKLRAWIGALAVLVFLNIPLIVNDIKTGGENTKEFFAAINDKSDKSDKNILEKAIRNYSEHSLGNFLVVSGYQEADFVKVDTQKNILKPLDIKCDFSCRKNLPMGVVAVLFFTAGIILLIANFFTQRERRKKDFVLVSALWLGTAFLVTVPVAYAHAPRFYLITAPLAFVFLGLIFQFVSKKIPKGRFLVLLVIVVLAASNLWALAVRFSEMKAAPYEKIEVGRDRILKEPARVTLEQQKMIVDHMESYHRENGQPLYFFSEPHYRRSMVYLTERRDINQDVLRAETVFKEGNHFLIFRTSADADSRLEKYLKSYKLVETTPFGTLTVFRLEPKEEAVTHINQIFLPPKPGVSGPNVQKRYTWNEIFGKEGAGLEED